MPNLIDELQQMASTPGVSASDLLRKAKIVAVKLKQTETAGWIDSELSGNFKETPAYRIVPVKLMYRNAIYGMQALVFADARVNEVVNAPRSLPRPIREIEELANGDDEALFMNLPPGIIEKLMEWGAPSPEISHMTPRTAMTGIIDAVKTRVLDWALMLEQNDVRGEGMSFSSEEQNRAKSISIHFNGNTNFAGVIGESTGIAASDVQQQLTSYVERAREVARKMREGAAHAAPDDAALLCATADMIDDAAENGTSGALRRALSWAKSALPKVGGFVTKAAAEHEIGQLLDLIPL